MYLALVLYRTFTHGIKETHENLEVIYTSKLYKSTKQDEIKICHFAKMVMECTHSMSARAHNATS